MLQQTRFSMYDLQGFRRTLESLDQLLIRKDYRLSEPTLEEKKSNQPKTQQKRKEEMLVKACQELGIANIIFEFKSIDLVNDKTAIKAAAILALQEQKNLIDLMLAIRVNRKIADLLEKEAAQIFAYNEQIKAYKLELAALLARDGSDFFLNQNDLADSKMQLEAQLFTMRQDIHAESMAKLNDLFNQVDKLANQYNDIQQMREKNTERHAENINQMVDDCEVEGEKVFNNDDKKKIQTLLAQKNQIKTDIENIDNEIKENENIIEVAKHDLQDNQKLQAKLIHEVEVEKQQATPAEQALLNECLDIFSEEVTCQIEEDLCTDQLEKLHIEKETYETLTPTAPTDKQMEIISKINKLAVEELRLQEKIAHLKEQHVKIQEKQKIKSRGFYDSKNKAQAAFKIAQCLKLKRDENELKQRIKRAESKIEQLNQKRNVLHENLSGIIHKIDDTFSKATNWIKNKVIQKKPGDQQAAGAAEKVVAKLKKDIEDESETSRQEDNAYAEQAADCAKQMQALAADAQAIAGVGANCNAQIQDISPHSQHHEALQQYQNKENEMVDKIHACVGTTLGAKAGAKLQAQVGI